MITLGVVYLSEIKDWNLVKSESKKLQAVFVDSEYHTKLSHFGFVFITKKRIQSIQFHDHFTRRKW